MTQNVISYTTYSLYTRKANLYELYEYAHIHTYARIYIYAYKKKNEKKKKKKRHKKKRTHTRCDENILFSLRCFRCLYQAKTYLLYNSSSRLNSFYLNHRAQQTRIFRYFVVHSFIYSSPQRQKQDAPQVTVRYPEINIELNVAIRRKLCELHEFNEDECAKAVSSFCQLQTKKREREKERQTDREAES